MLDRGERGGGGQSCGNLYKVNYQCYQLVEYTERRSLPMEGNSVTPGTSPPPSLREARGGESLRPRNVCHYYCKLLLRHTSHLVALHNVHMRKFTSVCQLGLGQ
jgi:hypothetical protein